MTDGSKVENLILGGGEAGKYIAWELAREGRRVVVVERGLIGGSCPNIACLPTKNIIGSAKVADLVQHAAEYGQRTGPITTDMKIVRQRKRAMVDGMVEIHRAKFAANGLEFLLGEGRFVAAQTVEVHLAEGGTRRLEAERIFLNLGTYAATPNLRGLAAAEPLTPVEALELDRLPEHLIVLGGGYVGVELAQAFRRLGSRVSVVEYGSQLMGREDPDVSDAVRTLFEDDGIEVILGADTQAVEGRSGKRVQIRLRTSKGERAIDGSDVLVAAGRRPNTKGIGLDLAGVELDQRGYIKVNDRLETTAPSVWALGECAGSPQFTHAAFDDFRVVRDNLAGINRTTQARLIPYCVFIDPELGRVGIGETEAQRLKIDVRVARVAMTSVLRARVMGGDRGFMKALIDIKSDRVRGFTMLGPQAGEVIAFVQTAMLAGLPYTGLRDAIFTHPTMAEGLNVLFMNFPPMEGDIRHAPPLRLQAESYD